MPMRAFQPSAFVSDPAAQCDSSLFVIPHQSRRNQCLINNSLPPPGLLRRLHTSTRWWGGSWGANWVGVRLRSSRQPWNQKKPPPHSLIPVIRESPSGAGRLQVPTATDSTRGRAREQGARRGPVQTSTCATAQGKLLSTRALRLRLIASNARPAARGRSPPRELWKQEFKLCPHGTSRPPSLSY